MGDPFGVKLPENLSAEAPAESSAPETDSGTEISLPSHGDLAPEVDDRSQKVSSEASRPETTAERLADLDKLERFRFEGREWTRKDLQNAILRQEDYTKKTQEVAEQRRRVEENNKFVLNFPIDLPKVVKDPSLMSQLAKHYPPEYVKIAQAIVARAAARQDGKGPAGNQPTVQQDQALRDDLEEVKSWIQGQNVERERAAVTQTEMWLDRQFEKLSPKFKFADPEVVNSRLIALNERGTAITPEVIENVFKQHDEQVQGRYKELSKTKVDKQREVNAKGRDIGRGGGTPGRAPVVPKNLKEARAAMDAEIASLKPTRVALTK